MVLTKTYRLFDGEDGFEFELGFESPDQERTLTYSLLGPHGIPIEGEWYTGTFRDVFFGQLDGDASSRDPHSPATSSRRRLPSGFQTLPLVFAGVENQYFAAFVAPIPPPR